MKVYTSNTRTEIFQSAVEIIVYNVEMAHERIFLIRGLRGKLTLLHMRDRDYFTVWFGS